MFGYKLWVNYVYKKSEQYTHCRPKTLILPGLQLIFPRQIFEIVRKKKTEMGSFPAAWNFTMRENAESSRIKFMVVPFGFRVGLGDCHGAPSLVHLRNLN